MGYTTSAAANMSKPELGRTLASFIYSNVELDQLKVESLETYGRWVSWFSLEDNLLKHIFLYFDNSSLFVRLIDK